MLSVKFYICYSCHCTVQCKGLPTSYFPIEPITWRFTSYLFNKNGIKIKQRITQHQLPIEPAFALTTYACQGQTISKVLADLTISGSSAYVQASRAQSRLDFFSMFPVTIAELNKPLSYALRNEDLRISALAHNTRMENNIKPGDIVNVPDAESDQGISFINTKPIFKINETTKCVQKRKRVNDNQISTVDSSLDNDEDSIFLQGCTWDLSM